MAMTLYMTVAMVAVGTTAMSIILVRKSVTSGFIVGGIAALCFATLFMIKLRCAVDAYPCGFMSFTGGFTWHFFAGLLSFAMLWILAGVLLNMMRASGWLVWMDHLGRAMAPLLGLGIAVVWEILPVTIIHPPYVDGPCPDIPIICHDIPVLGFGGLLYWTAPFMIWTAWTIWTDVGRLLVGDSIGSPRHS